VEALKAKEKEEKHLEQIKLRREQNAQRREKLKLLAGKKKRLTEQIQLLTAQLDGEEDSGEISEQLPPFEEQRGSEQESGALMRQQLLEQGQHIARLESQNKELSLSLSLVQSAKDAALMQRKEAEARREEKGVQIEETPRLQELKELRREKIRLEALVKAQGSLDVKIAKEMEELRRENSRIEAEVKVHGSMEDKLTKELQELRKKNSRLEAVVRGQGGIEVKNMEELVELRMEKSRLEAALKSQGGTGTGSLEDELGKSQAALEVKLAEIHRLQNELTEG
jgi:chromosome segregation ATPase